VKKHIAMLDDLIEKIDLPEEFLLSRIKLTVFGTSRALVENHRGILEYSADRIVIASVKEKLYIQGTGLIIDAMSGREILVGGRIQAVEWE